MEYKDTTITLSEKLKKSKMNFQIKTPIHFKNKRRKIIYCKTDYQPLIDLCNNQD